MSTRHEDKDLENLHPGPQVLGAVQQERRGFLVKAGKRIAAFTPYFTEEEAGQVRAAFLAAGRLEGDASVSDFIVRATMREVKRLQRKHHQGRAWDPAPPGSLRRGQRTRDELQHRNEGD